MFSMPGAARALKAKAPARARAGSRRRKNGSPGKIRTCGQPV